MLNLFFENYALTEYLLAFFIQVPRNVEIPVIEARSQVQWRYVPRTCCQVITLYSSGGASYLSGMYWYFSTMGVTNKTFQLVRSVFSFHVEMFFSLRVPKASLVIKRSKYEY